MLVAHDPTVKGGTSNPWTLKRSRANQIALENRLPVISLVESGGADLPTQKEIFIPGGRMFRDLTRLSAAGIPTIALVFGNSTAGGAYIPGMSDYVVAIKERSRFSGRASAGQDGHRRGVRRRVARRGRDARPHFRSGRLFRQRRTRRAAHRTAHRPGSPDQEGSRPLPFSEPLADPRNWSASSRRICGYPSTLAR